MDEVKKDKDHIEALHKEANKSLAKDMWFDSIDDLKRWHHKINDVVKEKKNEEIKKLSEDYKFKTINIHSQPLELEF